MQQTSFRSIFLVWIALITQSAFAVEPSFIFDQIEGEASIYPAAFENSAEKSLSVFWWNLRRGGEWSKKIPGNPLEQNLAALAGSKYAPEVMLFAEFVEGSFTDHTDRVLKALYPHRLYIPYGIHRADLGIQVYSKYPFGQVTSMLDWSPLRASPEARAKFKQKWRDGLDRAADEYYERPFIDLTLTKEKRLYHLVPVHLLNPWMPLADHIGRARTGLVILFGDDNPHYRQVERLMDEKIKPLLKRVKQEHSALLMVGDFNVPDQLLGVLPRGYQLMKRSLKNAEPVYGSRFTFPSLSSDMKNQRQMKIDHAFIGGDGRTVAHSRILFSGSDHYPIAVKVEPSDRI